MKYLLHMSTFISIITYLFWNYLPKGSFYIGNALFIFLLCVYIFVHDREKFINFVLLGFSINNLLDELFFDNTKLGINELAILIIIPLLWFLKRNKNV